MELSSLAKAFFGSGGVLEGVGVDPSSLGGSPLDAFGPWGGGRRSPHLTRCVG